MKASELIAQVQALIEEFGDLDVIVEIGLKERFVEQVCYTADDDEMWHGIAIRAPAVQGFVPPSCSPEGKAP